MSSISLINDHSTRNLLQVAYDGALKHNLIDFFRNESPPYDTGYMFWKRQELTLLSEWFNAQDLGMSGAGFGLACRMLQSYVRDPEATIIKFNYSISQINDKLIRQDLKLAYEGGVANNLIEFFRNVDPPTTGYMFWKCPEINVLSDWCTKRDPNIDLGFTLRLLQAYVRNPERTIAQCNKGTF